MNDKRRNTPRRRRGHRKGRHRRLLTVTRASRLLARASSASSPVPTPMALSSAMASGATRQQRQQQQGQGQGQGHGTQRPPTMMRMGEENYQQQQQPHVTSEMLSLRCHTLALLGEKEPFRLNAFTSIVPREDVLRQAKESDERRRCGRTLSPLDGIPITIKANIAVGGFGEGTGRSGDTGWWAGAVPTAASAILGAYDLEERMHLPNKGKRNDVRGGGGGGGYDSDVAHRLLRESGAVLIGLTNMDEFGMGSLGTYCQSPLSLSLYTTNISQPRPFCGGRRDHGRRALSRVHRSVWPPTSSLRLGKDDEKMGGGFVANPLHMLLAMQQQEEEARRARCGLEQMVDSSSSSPLSMLLGDASDTHEHHHHHHHEEKEHPYYYHDGEDDDDDDDDGWWLERLLAPLPDVDDNDDLLRELASYFPSSTTTTDPLYLPRYSCGGSSSGSAASVSFGSSLLSIGTDTGGSVRLPSAWTGLVGFKPTYGRISRYGVVSYASGLDCVGVLCPSVGDVALVLESLLNKKQTGEGNDANVGDDTRDGKKKEEENEWLEGRRDSTSVVSTFCNPLTRNRTGCHRSLQHGRGECNEGVNKDNDNTRSTSRAKSDPLPEHARHSTATATARTPRPTPSRPRPLEGLTVGIPEAFVVREMSSDVREAWSVGAKRLAMIGGADVVIVPANVVTVESIRSSLASYYVLASAEAASNLSRFDGVRYGMGGGGDDGDMPNYDMLPGQLGHLRPEEGREDDDDNNDNDDDEDGDEEARAMSRAWSDMTPFEKRISACRALGFGPEVIRRILCGTAVLSSDRFHTHYESAATLRASLVQEFEHAFFGNWYEDDDAEGDDSRGEDREEDEEYGLGAEEKSQGVEEEEEEEAVKGHRRRRRGQQRQSLSRKRRNVDLMLVPTALFPPPRLDANGNGDNNDVSEGEGEEAAAAALRHKSLANGTEMFANDVMTVPISLAGLPSASVPVRRTLVRVRKPPGVVRDATDDVDDDHDANTTTTTTTTAAAMIGLQVFGPQLSEETVLRAAAVLEGTTIRIRE